MELPQEEKLLSKILQFDFSKYADVDKLKAKLELFISDEKYNKILFNNNADLSKVCSIDLSFFTNKSFRAANYPKQEKLIPKYREDLALHIDFGSAVMFGLIQMVANKNSSNPKILAIPNFSTLISASHFETEISQLLAGITKNNGLILSAFDLTNYKDFENSQFWTIFLQQQATSITLAGEGLNKSFREFLNFSDEEMGILLKLPVKNRCFVLKQYGFAISAEMNLNECAQFAKILSQSEQDRRIYKELKTSHSDLELLLHKLYKKLEDE
jgi:type IV secretory pathway VirB4 component